MRTRIYTDGSLDQKNKIGSWSIVISERKEIKKYSGISKGKSITNNKMELKAIVKALTIIEINKYKNVEILTDSAYVINNIKRKSYEEWILNCWKTKKGEYIKNYEEWMMFLYIIKELNENGYIIKFSKVKAHSNNSLNQKADEEARRIIREVRKNG